MSIPSSQPKRTAIVLGANRGIGLALCQCLKERGRAVVAVCRKISSELRSIGVTIESGVDVTNDYDLRALAGKLASPVDELVCNAGVLHADSFGDVNLDDVRTQIEVNALGPLRAVKALRKHLRAGSKVALITSRMGSMGDNGSGGYYGYRMSKAALNAAGVSLARDLAGAEVAVAILHPGFVRTEMTGGAGQLDPAQSAAMLVDRIDQLTAATSGTFWHANGEVLPW